MRPSEDGAATFRVAAVLTDGTQTRCCRRNQRCRGALIQSAPLALRGMMEQSWAVIRVATHTAERHTNRRTGRKQGMALSPQIQSFFGCFPNSTKAE